MQPPYSLFSFSLNPSISSSARYSSQNHGVEESDHFFNLTNLNKDYSVVKNIRS